MVDETLEARLYYVRMNTIYEVLSGSHAYGMSLPTSDVDIRGVCIMPDKRYFTGMQHFEQQDKGWETDKCIFHLPKFIALAAECNPNIIEILYVDEKDIRVMLRLGRILRESRNLFLSRSAAERFTKYAYGEMQRMKAHHRWMKEQPSKPSQDQFTHTKDFVQGPLGTTLPQGAQIKSIRQARLSDFQDGTLPDRAWEASSNLSDWHIIAATVFDKGGYEGKKNDYEHYTKWRATRNEARAALEEKAGYDTKNAAHLVRLLRMGKEIIERGDVIVKRPDAAELLEIRHGAWSYEKLIDYAAEMDAVVRAGYDKSPLPVRPDMAKIEELQMRLIEEHTFGLQPHDCEASRGVNSPLGRGV